MEGSNLRQKYFTYSVIIIALFIGAWGTSILAPFYPAKAAEKGVTPSQFGFVIGIFQLVICLSAPIYGKYMAVIGPTFLFKAGAFVTGTCTLMFGFLDKSPPYDTFLALSFAVRIVAGFGESAIFTSAYIIVPTLFPESVATAVSFIETAFCLGELIGTAVGEALFQLGGFLLPFEVAGAMLTAIALIAMFTIPNLKAWAVGLVFMTGGVTYAIMATIWGRVMDKKGNKYMPVMILSKVIGCVAYLFLGPAPFIPLKKSILLVTVGLACNGLGLAGTMVGSYVGMMDTLMKHNFPSDLQTQGIVAGLFNFAFSLGAFIGPSIAGTLYDSVGFAYGSLVVLGILCAVTIALAIYALVRVKRKKSVGVMLVSVIALNPDAINGSITISNDKLQQPPTTAIL